MRKQTTALVSVVLGATLSTARADDTESGAAPPAAMDPAPTASAAGVERLTLPKGRLVLDAALTINLSDGAVGKPISISPDLWYGVDDKLTVGLVHTAAGSTGFLGGVGGSLCLSGSDNGCADVYNNVGLEARYELKPGTPELSWVLDGGVYALATDPFTLAVKLGAIGRWHKDKLAVEASPNLFIGVTERTSGGEGGTTEVTTNGETLYLPVTGIYTVAPKIAVAAQLGLVLPFEETGDTYRVPLSLGAHYTVDESIVANVAFSLPALIGGGEGTGADARVLTIGGTYAF